MPFVHDSTVKERQARIDPIEEYKAQVKQFVDFHLSQARLIEDGDLSPTNAERQLGQMMLPKELEARLGKLVPNLHFEVNQFNPRMKALYFVYPNGRKEYLLAYHNEVMPEYSIMKGKWKEYFDPSLLKQVSPGGLGHIERGDLPKGELTAEGWKYDEKAHKPGMRRIFEPWGESKRGWRTVVARLVQYGYISPAQAELSFGTSERKAWNAYVGDKTVSPW